ncbi:LmbE family N-acetylglucosaminyl deacetylase [Bacillus mesophilus]|uniref:PIG-L family deacetylase n=1 Tax=Bacillus mesophilus TaxID=1808955 RepID=A0A6M0QAW7_9BACI|nr:PIG-L family deacetylase [Bacillus mesophilus]MBM7662853.1 LmbE family N-acetylglucosaminyl deacetylase [Bacillus mesophilus]NEY73443.1 PIG-L family deacetylase [Bacillus mesophilus]
MFKVNRLLVLAPHTDDAELGAGGLIARMIEEGVEVFVVAFSSAEDSLPEDLAADTLCKEFKQAMSVLGVKEEYTRVLPYKVRNFSCKRQEILEDIVKLRGEIQPDLVCLPCSQDVHQDHNVIHNEGVRVFKHIPVLGYELPWNQTSFSSQAFVELEERHIDLKWKALQSYQSQIQLSRPYFYEEFIYGLARIRGVQIKKTWAESYEVLRVVI